MSESDGDGLLFSADGTPRWVTPAVRFGVNAGLPLLAFVLAALFVLPGHPLAVTFDGGVLVSPRDGVGTGAVTTVAAASLVAGTVAGVGYPLVAGGSLAGSRLELAFGVVGPTGVAMGTGGASAVVLPSLAIAAGGDPFDALLVAVNASQAVAIVVTLFGVAYVAVPSLVGVTAGGLLARGVGVGGIDR